MTTQTASTELTLDQLDSVNGGSWNPYDWFEDIVDSIYDAYDASEDRKAKQRHAAKTGRTDGSF